MGDGNNTNKKPEGAPAQEKRQDDEAASPQQSTTTATNDSGETSSSSNSTENSINSNNDDPVVLDRSTSGRGKPSNPASALAVLKNHQQKKKQKTQTVAATTPVSTAAGVGTSAPSPTNMASHAPIRIKLTTNNSTTSSSKSQKSRKRRLRSNNAIAANSKPTTGTDSGVGGTSDSSEDDQDYDLSFAPAAPSSGNSMNEHTLQQQKHATSGPTASTDTPPQDSSNNRVDQGNQEPKEETKSDGQGPQPMEKEEEQHLASTNNATTTVNRNPAEDDLKQSNIDSQTTNNKLGQANASHVSTTATSNEAHREESALDSSRSDHPQNYGDVNNKTVNTGRSSAIHELHAHSLQQQHRHKTSTSPPEQPDGWRVKLYRLNMDGSWDDCGTGRIVCLYRTQSSRPSPQQQQQQLHNPQDDAATAMENNPNNRNSMILNEETHNNNNNNNNPLHPRPLSIRPAPQQTTDQWLYQETGEGTLCVQAELTKANRQPRVLLRTRILLRDPYQRQGDNIITWCEPFYAQQQQTQNHNSAPNEHGGNLSNTNDSNPPPGVGVDLALSFQDNAGCLDIWRQITQVQSRAAELLRSLPSDDSVQRMAAAIAAQHHAHMHSQAGGLANGAANGAVDGGGVSHSHHQQQQQQQQDLVAWGGVQMHDDANAAGGPLGGTEYMMESQIHLPDPPTFANLEQIGDTIAAIQNVQQREAMANVIAKEECAYLRALLSLFPEAEERNDYGKLATLAACVKTILLMNEPSILELVVAVAELFEQVCSCLEYDPDLREKANHRWFLRERAKFRTVVAMDNAELVSAIHRSFRVNFLRDTLLRPTMDESSLSTLSSLQTFSHADVVKGVTMSPNGEEVSLTESYLVRVIRMLGIELHAICVLEWKRLDNNSFHDSSKSGSNLNDDLLSLAKDPSTVVGENPLDGTTWKQYLAPQDSSLASRRLRRRGCLSFLRELFNMVRLSLQQNDKDDFFSVISTLDVDLIEDVSDVVSQTSQTAEAGSVASSEPKGDVHAVETNHLTSPVSLLSLLGNALADPNMDASEKESVLEIISGVAMHDPSFIRRHCIDYYSARKETEKESSRGDGDPHLIVGRPDPNEKKQVIHIPPQHDLMASLLFLLNVTTDAGILLQATEIVRIILDTEVISDSGSGGAGFKDEAEGVSMGQHNGGPHHEQHSHPSPAGAATSNDQKQFFSLFYEHYMEWLVAPFQFTLLHPVRKVPEFVLKNPPESRTMQAILSSWRSGAREDDKFLMTVPFNAIRSSFAVELLSFCVRSHLYRMKFFLLKSRVLGNVLALLRPNRSPELSGDRSLKLAALRFLRSILSVHDEFYHRHIIQHDLFAHVFAALRENPVGDNLVSSSIVEMCDYIHNENIKSLIEYIVTEHLSPDQPENTMPRLEDVSSPYVTTLTVLREAYEANRKSNQHAQVVVHGNTTGATGPSSPGGSRYFSPSGSAAHHHSVPRVLSGKALEDQRKFQEADEEESYFESDDAVAESPSPLSPQPNETATPPPSNAAPLTVPMQVDEVDASASTVPGEGIAELHRTQRMFSLAQAPLLNNLDDKKSPPPPSSSSISSCGQANIRAVEKRSVSSPLVDSLSSTSEGNEESAADRMEEEESDLVLPKLDRKDFGS